MAKNWFYLHFRRPPSPETLEMLLENGVELEQVFETSYDVVASMSGASLRRLLKFNAPNEEYNLVKAVDSSHMAPRDSSGS